MIKSPRIALVVLLLITSCQTRLSQLTPSNTILTLEQSSEPTLSPQATQTASLRKWEPNAIVLNTPAPTQPLQDFPTIEDETMPDDRKLLQQLIDQAIINGDDLLSIPKGVYYIGRTFGILDAKDLIIDGNDTTIIFTMARNPAAGISHGMIIENAKRLTIRNITFDYDPLPYTQGTILAIDPAGTWYDVQVHQGYRSDIAFFKNSLGELSLHIFDPKTYQFKLNTNFYFPDDVTDQGNGILRFWFIRNPDPIHRNYMEIGDMVATSMYRAIPLRIHNSAEIHLENVTFWSAAGSAIIDVGGDGGGDYQFNIVPGPPPPGATVPRLYSSSRDGYHGGNMRRGPTIHNSRFEAMADDAINIFMEMYIVKAVDLDVTQSFQISPTGSVSPLKPGDTAIVYDQTSGIEKGRAFLTGAQSVSMIDESNRQSTLKLDQVQIGDFVVIPEYANRDIIIRDNVFRNLEAAAVNLKGIGVLMENNLIEHVGQPPIAIGISFNYYYEGPYPEHIIIRNNSIRDVGFGRLFRSDWWGLNAAINIAPQTVPDPKALRGNRQNKDILIENNTIEEVSVWGLLIANASGVTVRGNRFSHTNLLPPLEAGRWWNVTPSSAIFVVDSDHVTFTDNLVSALGQYASQAIIIDPSCDLDTIDASGVRLTP